MKVLLKKLLDENERSKAEIAEIVGVSRQTLHAIETQKYCPSVLTALKLAKVLKVDLNAIFKLEEKDL